MRGVEGFFSRRKLVDRAELEHLAEVWITPCRPRWGYVPIAPFRLVHVHLGDDRLMGFDTYTSVAKALYDFGNCHQPRNQESCGIVDGRDQMIIAWASDSEDEYQWYGCRFAFEVLEACQVGEGQTCPRVTAWSIKVAHWEELARSNQ